MMYRRTIDHRLSEYQGIYDHAKVQGVLNIIRNSWLDLPFFDLCMHWKAASNALRLPWLTVKCVESTFRENAVRKVRPPMYLNALSSQLLAEVPELPKGAKLKLQSKIRDLMNRLDHHLARPAPEPEVEQSRQEYWEKLISRESGAEFALSVMGSQLISFNAIFGAFENFMREIMIKLENNANFRVSYSKRDHVKKYLSRHLPVSQVETFFRQGGEFDIARIIRNSLAHHGGRRTDEINDVIKEPKFRYKFDDGDWVRIWPGDNRHLMTFLLQEIATWSGILVTKTP